MKEISPEKIEALLSRPKRGNSRKGVDLSLKENRNLMVWIKLWHQLGYCSNPECPDQRPRKVAEGNAMCTPLDEDRTLLVCRLCFLAGYGLDKSVRMV
jgi:hypothetical protein